MVEHAPVTFVAFLEEGLAMFFAFLWKNILFFWRHEITYCMNIRYFSLFSYFDIIYKWRTYHCLHFSISHTWYEKKRYG
jgi:hypothetical protein